MFLPIQPNYINPMVERLEWLTDVQVASNGTEIRRPLRQLPRSSLSFSFGLPGARASRFRNILRNYQGKVVQAPWWPGAICTTTTGSFHTPYKSGDGWAEDNFAVGEHAVYYRNFDDFELTTVVDLDHGYIETSPPTKLWPIGTNLVPVRDFYLASSQTIEAPTAGLSTGTIVLDQVAHYGARFEVENIEFDPLWEKPNRASQTSEEWTRLIEELDFHTGGRYLDDYTNQPTVSRSFEYVLTSKPKTSAFRAWLHYLACGRLNDFELPTWQCDFQVVGQPPVGVSSARFDVVNAGHSTLSPRPAKIRLSGTRQSSAVPPPPSPPPPVLPWVAFPTVTNIVEMSPTIERVSTTNLGAFTRFNVQMASWVDVVRLDSDAIEIAHLSGEVARVQLPFKTLRIP